MQDFEALFIRMWKGKSVEADITMLAGSFWGKQDIQSAIVRFDEPEEKER